MTYYKLKIQIELFLGRVSGDQFSPRTSGEGISIGGAEHSSHSAKAATNYKVNQDFPGGTFPRKNVGKIPKFLFRNTLKSSMKTFSYPSSLVFQMVDFCPVVKRWSENRSEKAY